MPSVSEQHPRISFWGSLCAQSVSQQHVHIRVFFFNLGGGGGVVCFCPDSDSTQILSVNHPKIDFVSDIVSCRWSANDRDLLHFIFTLWVCKKGGRIRHTHDMGAFACAHTRAHPPPITVMVLTFRVRCRVGCVYLWWG